MTPAGARRATSLTLSSVGPFVTITSRVSRPGRRVPSPSPNARQKSAQVPHPLDRNASSVVWLVPTTPAAAAAPSGVTPARSKAVAATGSAWLRGSGTPGRVRISTGDRTPPVVDDSVSAGTVSS